MKSKKMPMRKKIILITIAMVAATLAIVLVLNPFGLSPFGPSGNSTNTTNNNTSNHMEPPITSNWISPGTIFIDNYEPGKTVAIQLQIHNGNSIPAKFSVDYRYPDSLTEGYSKPVDASSWVIPKERFPVIPAQETYNAIIWLSMPSGATPPGDKWEFWLGVIDQSQSGTLVTELAARILVSMK